MYIRPAFNILCGNTLIIFVLFVKIESLELPETRIKYPLPLSSVKIIELMDNIYKTNGFADEIKLHYKSENIKLIASDMKQFHENWHTNIANMRTIFSEAVHDYIVKKLRDYCQIVLELIKNHSPNVLTIEDIKLFDLSYNNDFYYMIEFLNNYVDNISSIFDVIFFFDLWPHTAKALETREKENNNFEIPKFTKEETTIKVTDFRENLKFINQSKTGHLDVDIKNLTTKTSLLEKLKEIVDDIVKFAILFQAYSLKPILEKNLFVPRIGAPIHNPPIITDILTNEYCFVMLYQDDKTLVSQKGRISRWDCNGIAKDTEFSDNKGSIDNQKKGALDIILSTMPCNKIKSLPGEVNVNLSTLKEIIRYQSFYLNAVQYHNILADVVVLTAIKEGTKPMKAIKSKMKVACDNKKTTDLTMDEILVMRGSLLMIKLYFDDLMKNIMKQYPTLFLTEDGKTNINNFRYKSINLLKYLNISKIVFDYLEDNCDLILNLLSDVGDVKVIDNPLEFKQYYFFSPPTNVFQIHHFYLSKSKYINEV